VRGSVYGREFMPATNNDRVFGRPHRRIEEIMRPTDCHLVAMLLGFTLLTSGCGDVIAPSTSGAIRVDVSTTGAGGNADPDGYTLSVDGGPAQPLGTYGTVTIPDLPTGDHLVQLNGVASNCSVLGTNPRPVVVVGNRDATAPVLVPFVVSCAARTGSVRISTTTSGLNLDPDGYAVIAAGVPKGSVPATGTVDISDVPVGRVDVKLGAVSANCVVDTNPRSVDVTQGAIVDVAFAIRCEQPGSIRVTISTTGVNLDANGYALDIRLQDTLVMSAGVPTNGTVTYSGLLPGNYTLTLSDMVPNCQLAGTVPRAVTVASGSTTSVSLDITCEAPSEIAYVSAAGANADIYVLSSNGTGSYQVTSQLGSDADPAWSPDGSRMAFTSERDGNREIYVMNANGANAERLTNAPFEDYRPAWSPDGQRIAFVSMRDGNAEIYVINTDGSNPVRLTTNATYDSDPTWSPDGSRIAFSSDRGGIFGIWVMNADGSNPVRLTSNARPDRQPAWSPDGTRIAFSRESVSTSDIFVISPDGSGLIQLTHDIASAADPDWSPDGRRIAIGSSPLECGPWDYGCDPYILIIGSDGTPYSALTSPAFNPAWRP
jgi:Tol biopolymer transport system component